MLTPGLGTSKPGATVAIPAFPESPIDKNAFMIPQTVPKRPSRGPALAPIASEICPLSNSLICSTVSVSRAD